MSTGVSRVRSLMIASFALVSASAAPEGPFARENERGSLAKECMVKVGGVRFEFLVPKERWPIPAKPTRLPLPKGDAGPRSPIQLGLRITNLTKGPLRFSRKDTITLEMTGPGGRPVERGGGRDATRPSDESDFPLVKPGESVTFPIDATIDWLEGTPRLVCPDGFGGHWTFENLGKGPYQIRVRYSNEDGSVVLRSQGIDKTLKGIWTGGAVTPYANVKLVEPAG